MILSTYHPSVSAAPELVIRYPIDNLRDEETIARRTTISSFNHHMLSEETQNKVLDLMEMLIYNEERVSKARDALLKDPEFDPLLLFQRLTHGCAASTNTLTLKTLAGFAQRPLEDIKLYFHPLRQLSYLDFYKRILLVPHETDAQDSPYLTQRTTSQVYRQLDFLDPEQVQAEDKLRDILRLYLDAQYLIEEQKRVVLSSPDLGFDRRKLFSMLLSVNGSQVLSQQLDRTLTNTDIRRFFTLNNRLIEESKVSRYLILPWSLGLSHSNLTYEQFATLFSPQGKELIVSYPQKAQVRSNPSKVEVEMLKSQLLSIMTVPKSQGLTVNSVSQKIPLIKSQKLEATAKTLDSQKSKSKMRSTGSFRSDQIANETILGFFLQQYLPEQVRLDDELERLRIDCIADLVREKASIRGLYNEVLAKSVDLSNEPCCTPKDLLSFLQDSQGVHGLTLADVELTFSYYLHQEHYGNGQRLAFSQLLDLLLRPISADFSGYLTAFAEHPSSRYLPMSGTSKATLARFLTGLILNTLKNREVRRTYQVLAKGKGTSVLRMIMPRTQDGDLSLNMSSNSINEKATSSKLDFETFLEFVRTRGAVCGLSPRDVEYLRKRFTRNNTEQEMITVEEFADNVTRWL